MIVTDEYIDENRPEDAAEAAAETDTITAADEAVADDAVTAEEPPQYGVGPFSIREVALAGVWLIAFIASFFPVYGEIGSGPTVWGSGIDWLLTIGVPTVAVFLIVLRRLSPQGIRRVGSLGIDQFASVAFSVSTVLWLATIWTSFITLFGQNVFAGTWVVWVEFIMMLAGVFLTVLAPFIPPFSQDFIGRAEVPAHRVARPARPVAPRPAPAVGPAAEAAGPVYADYAAPADGADASADDVYAAPADGAESTATTAYTIAETDAITDGETGTDAATAGGAAVAAAGAEAIVTEAAADPEAEAPVAVVPEAGAETPVAVVPVPVPDPDPEPEAEAEPDPAPDPAPAAVAEEPVVAPQHQAFWALVPEERDIVDEIGIPVFRIGPTAWALVIEDRGAVFVVRHEDGRIGYLHDVSGVTRG